MKALFMSAFMAMACPLALADAASFHIDMNAAFQDCASRYEANTDAIAPLAGKLPTKAGGERSLEMLSSDALAAEREKPAIARLSSILNECREQYAKTHTAHGVSGGVAVFGNLSAASDVVFSDLYKGAITYGEANRRFRQLSSQADAALMAEYEKADQLAATSAAAEARQPSGTGVFLQNMADQLRRSPPNTTTCQKVGFQVQCTSR